MKKGKKIVCKNKKAPYDYFIEEVYDAGLVLLGPEVKSLREGRASLVDSYAKVKKGEVFLYNMHINPYPYARYMNLDPVRTRKLLLTKREIKRLIGKTEQKGYSLIPLEVYFSGPWAKVDLALAKGKRKIDKRQAIKERDLKREMDQARKRGKD
ncbi:MAG: SsrA-binding protein SmpB [Deltaproteobacteria bacterium]|nr:SsrA-binding protein SmpB [Deltaproteobacteria bacterium]MBW2302234.1 SsrA-binding protein SmpB [Deltaproteobacteria bacterium]